MTVALALMIATGIASADPPEPPADRARGLENPDPLEAGDVLLAVPRLVLAVPRVALRVVSLPILGLARLEEEHHVFSWLEDLFYNDARTAAIIPYAMVDSSLGPAVGLIAFHDDLFGHREQLRLRGRFGGAADQSYQLSFKVGQATQLSGLARYEVADGLLFHGLGADGPEATFEQERILGVLRGAQRIGLLELHATGIYNHRDFRGGSIEEQYDTSTINGFDEGVETLELQAGLGFVTRALRAEAFVGGVPTGGKYWHWGVEVTGQLELWAEGRILLARAAAEGVEGDDIPFSDLPRLGGATRMRGYPLDRFRGTTAVLGTLEYHYPVHQMVKGALFVDVGHVTDNDWHVGGGLGLVVQSGERQLLSLEVAYGESLQFIVSTDPLRAFAKKDTEL